MSVRRSKTELNLWQVERLTAGIQLGFLDEPYATGSRRLMGDSAMALAANGKRFCKVVHTENGRTTTRRIHTIMVQSADGRLHHLDGKRLPDSISLYSGVPHSGAHLAEVLLSPKDAKGTPLPTMRGWISKRDACFMGLGIFCVRLIALLAEAVVISIS